MMSSFNIFYLFFFFELLIEFIHSSSKFGEHPHGYSLDSLSDKVLISVLFSYFSEVLS